MKAKKRRILDCSLKTIPDHLKTKAKRICDDLKIKDRLFILPSHEINIDGKTLRGSHIRHLVMHELLKPQTPGCIQYKLLEDETELLRSLLKHSIKESDRKRGGPLCREFESMFDGTVEYFDDKDSDKEEEEEDDDEEDSDQDKRSDKDDEDASDSDDSGDTSDENKDASDEDEDEDDDTEEEEVYEPRPKKNKKKMKY